jgi:hypothetical protein
MLIALYYHVAIRYVQSHSFCLQKCVTKYHILSSLLLPIEFVGEFVRAKNVLVQQGNNSFNNELFDILYRYTNLYVAINKHGKFSEDFPFNM